MQMADHVMEAKNARVPFRATRLARGVAAALAIAPLVLGAGVSAAGTNAAAPFPAGHFVLMSSGAAHMTTLEAGTLAAAAAPPFILAQDALNLEDDEGYSTEYIFGMSKGIMRSTLVPALKPFVLLFTIPLDLAFLPFAAIAGAL